MSLLLALAAQFGTAFASQGPQVVEDEERQRLMQMLAQIDLPAVESFGALPQSSSQAPPSLTPRPVPPPLPMAGLPARQHDVEEETKS